MRTAGGFPDTLHCRHVARVDSGIGEEAVMTAGSPERALELAMMAVRVGLDS